MEKRPTNVLACCRWLWAAKQIADRDAGALWGFLADLHSEYAPNGGDAFLDCPPRTTTEVLRAEMRKEGFKGGVLEPNACMRPTTAMTGAYTPSLASHFALGMSTLGGGRSSIFSGAASARSSLQLSPRSRGAATWGEGSAALSHTAGTLGGDRAGDPSTRLWLQQLGITVRGEDGAGGGGTDAGGAQPLSTKDYPSLDRGLALLDDPQRNGRLVWDVAVAVAALQVQNQEQLSALREGRKPRQRPKNPDIFKIPFRRPRAMGEARANMSEALGLLCGCGLTLPEALSNEGVIEAILQGSESALWSLMSAIRVAAAGISVPAGAAPSAVVSVIAEETRLKASTARGRSRVRRGGGGGTEGVLPYRRRDVALLEVAVMQWMLTLPLLPDSLEALTHAVCYGDAPPPSAHVQGSLRLGGGKATRSTLLSELAKGPLLVDVASAATGVQFQPVTRAVKTHKVAANNQQRLCEQLLQINHLSHQHLVPVDEAAESLAAGEHAVTLGLLEDLMRCSFRVRPNKRFFNAKGREVPFLGPYAPAPATLSSDVPPFQTGVEPAETASWGAWGRDGGAAYSVRVAAKGRASCDGLETGSKASVSSSPRRADRRQSGASGVRPPHSRSPSKGGSDKENLGECSASVPARDDTAVPLASANANRWALARHPAAGPRSLEARMSSTSRQMGPRIVERAAAAEDERLPDGGPRGEPEDVYKELRRARSLGRGRAQANRSDAGASRPARATARGKARASRVRSSDGSRDAACVPQYAGVRIPTPKRLSDPGGGAGTGTRGELGYEDTEDVTEETANKELLARMTVVRRWLVKLPSAHLPPWPKGVLFGSPLEFAHAWSDGVALCDLLAAIEGVDSGRIVPGGGIARLAGVNRAPKSAASCRHNLSKALDILRTKRGMNRAHLFDEVPPLPTSPVALHLLVHAQLPPPPSIARAVPPDPKLGH